MLLLSEDNPLAPLDRRWRRAAQLLADGLPLSPDYDDAWVQQALDYRTALAGCQDEAGRLTLAPAMPALAQAHALHEAGSPLLRWAVEAYVLAGESCDAVARRFGLLPETVEAYERVFFAVRDRLAADGWVLCHVIGRQMHYGLTEQDLDVLWRFVGYYFGPVMLDALFLGNPGLPRPATPQELADALGGHADVRVALQKVVALHLLPVTPGNALEVVRVLSQLNPPAAAADVGGGAPPLATSWDALVNQVAAENGSRPVPGPEGPKAARKAG
jgi:hypothetical protein